MKNERQPRSPKLHLIDEVAAILRVSTKTVRRLIDKRELTPAVSGGRSGCTRMTSRATSIGNAADDRARPLVALQVNANNSVGDTSDDLSNRMVIVRITVMPLISSGVAPRSVLSIQHIPEGEINGH
jgi:Helix-turn-helix domain